MSPLSFFASADIASLGRFNKDCLSEQMIMEIFMDSFVLNNESRFKDAQGYFTEIESWHPQLRFDDQRRIMLIRFTGLFKGGELSQENLPPHLQEMRVNANYLTGEVELTCLPQTMEFLDVSCNALTGTIDLSQLPPKFESLDCHRNGLSGELNLRTLRGHIDHINDSFRYLPEGDTTRRYSFDFTWNDFDDKILLGKESDYRSYAMFGRLGFRTFIYES